MRCPNCAHEIPAEAAFENLSATAPKLGPSDFLTKTPKGNLLRVRVVYTRHDAEAGMDHFKVQIAPAADDTGDVAKGLQGENMIFPAFPVAVRSEAIQHGPGGKPLISLTGVLADAIASQIAAAEARLYAAQHLSSIFGAPEG
jgi:hypothetical protein